MNGPEALDPGERAVDVERELRSFPGGDEQGWKMGRVENRLRGRRLRVGGCARAEQDDCQQDRGGRAEREPEKRWSRRETSEQRSSHGAPSFAVEATVAPQQGDEARRDDLALSCDD